MRDWDQRPPGVEVEVQPNGAAPLSCTFCALAMILVPGHRGRLGIEPGCFDELGVPALHDDIEQPRPDVELVLV